MADLPVADGGDGTLAAAIAAGYDRVPMTAAGPTGLRHRYTHVRLTIYPDGGVARFRVHGDPMPDPRLLTGTVDLAGLENGGTVIDCSNMFYPSPLNILRPDRAHNMGDGWENARRRDSGNDHVTVRLATRGSVRSSGSRRPSARTAALLSLTAVGRRGRE